MGFTLPSQSNLIRVARNNISEKKQSKHSGHLSPFEIPNSESKEMIRREKHREFDEATNLVNATLFYEHLERQIAQVRRDNSKFRIIRILIPDASTEEDLIDFAFALNESTRNEDIVSRIGNFEFVVLLRLNPNSEDKSKDIIKRVSDIYSGIFLFSTNKRAL